jgi:hypothetical protein
MQLKTISHPWCRPLLVSPCSLWVSFQTRSSRAEVIFATALIIRAPWHSALLETTVYGHRIPRNARRSSTYFSNMVTSWTLLGCMPMAPLSKYISLEIGDWGSSNIHDHLLATALGQTRSQKCLDWHKVSAASNELGSSHSIFDPWKCSPITLLPSGFILSILETTPLQLYALPSLLLSSNFTAVKSAFSISMPLIAVCHSRKPSKN